MAITYGFFNSLDGDRKYNAEEMSHYFDGIISNGVFEAIGDRLQVTGGDGLTVNVGTGRAMIDSHWIKNDAVLSLALEAADVQYKRTDAVVVKLDMANRAMSIEIVTGTPGIGYRTPIIYDTSEVKHLQLAHIRIPAGATTIDQAQIIDVRGDTVKCGYVTGVIEQVDTSQLFAQWQDACETYYENMTSTMDNWFRAKQNDFKAWFDTLTEQLVVDTTIVQYQHSVVVGGASMIIGINIEDYAEGDILLVFVNGVHFVRGVDYTISTDYKSIVLAKTLDFGDRVTFIVLKSKIGGNLALVQNAAIAADGLEGTVATASFEEVAE